jgi:hypothetical protein
MAQTADIHNVVERYGKAAAWVTFGVLFAGALYFGLLYVVTLQ